ncbi:MAG: hypothetical protein MUF15_27415 [Acidobacteria bacterium]|nr:hypothetical protein [Acidobacteriota bacterium]
MSKKAFLHFYFLRDIFHFEKAKPSWTLPKPWHLNEENLASKTLELQIF